MAKFTDKITLSLIKRVLIIAICVGFVLFGIISTAVSWSSYRDYYGEMLERKSVYDEANATPVTVMNGITIACADGVEFFDNGKAAPTKNSFSVKGLYNVSGRDYEEDITDYELDVPDDFAQNGGRVTATYLYEETKIFDEKREVVTENGTETVVTPVEKHFKRTFTASIDISLTDVMPEKLVVTSEPYSVCYRENSLFDKTGMTAVVAYNDGSVFDDVDTDDITVENNTPLKTSDTEVVLSYSLEGVTVKGSVPVTVMSEATFTNGEAIDMFVNGGVNVDAGKALSTAQADVMVKYGSGNIVRLSDSEYEKSFGTHEGDEIAQLGGNYVMTIDAGDGVNKKFGVNVVSLKEAESVTLSGCSEEVIGDKTVVSGISDGSSLEFSVIASEPTYVDLYADMSNGYIVKTGDKYYSQNIAVNTFMQIRVNGVLKAADSDQLSVGGPYDSKEAALASMRRVRIGKVYANAGDNTVKISFRNNINGLKDCDGNEPFGKIDAIGVTAEGAVIYNYFGEYIGSLEETLSSPELTVTMHSSWENMLDPYIVGSTTDGTYIYYAFGKSIDPEPNDDEYYKYLFPVRIAKYDPVGDRIVGYSSSFTTYSSIQWAHFLSVKMFCKGGYVYTFDGEGKPLKISAEDLEQKGTVGLTPADEITFSEELVKMLNDLQYSTENQKYVGVGTDGYVHIYGSDMNEEKYFKAATSQSFRLTLDKDYIYVMSGSVWDNGNYKPTIYIYDWEGNLIAESAIDLSKVANATGADASERALTQVGTSLYIAVRGWRDPWGSAIFKIDFDRPGESDHEKLSLGAYFEACESKGVEMKYDTTAVNTSRINGTPNYMHGFCTDGTYYYASANDGKSTKIYKLDLGNKSVVGYTETYERADTWNNADYIYYKDGYVYIVKYDGKGTLARVKCDDINKFGTAAIENVEGGIKAPENKVLKSATYDVTQNKYAAIMSDNTTLCVYDGATNEITAQTTFNYRTVLGMYSDENYVYALYESSPNATDKTTAGILIFSWAGEQIANVTLKNVHSATSNVNVQGMCVSDGEIYLMVTEWATNGMFVVKLDLDYSVLG